MYIRNLKICNHVAVAVTTDSTLTIMPTSVTTTVNEATTVTESSITVTATEPSITTTVTEPSPNDTDILNDEGEAFNFYKMCVCIC